jgi:hypothetical protein
MKIIQLFSSKQIFYEQIRHKLSLVYKKIVRYALNYEYFRKNKIDTQSRADAYIRTKEKEVNCKSDYNLTSGCT